VRAAEAAGLDGGIGTGTGMIAPVLCRTHSFNDFEMVWRFHEERLRPRLVHLHTAECMITRPGMDLNERGMVCQQTGERAREEWAVRERLRGHLIKG
jgi:hypothetical protein